MKHLWLIIESTHPCAEPTRFMVFKTKAMALKRCRADGFKVDIVGYFYNEEKDLYRDIKEVYYYE